MADDREQHNNEQHASLACVIADVEATRRQAGHGVRRGDGPHRRDQLRRIRWGEIVDRWLWLLGHWHVSLLGDVVVGKAVDICDIAGRGGRRSKSLRPLKLGWTGDHGAKRIWACGEMRHGVGDMDRGAADVLAQRLEQQLVVVHDVAHRHETRNGFVGLHKAEGGETLDEGCQEGLIVHGGVVKRIDAHPTPRMLCVSIRAPKL